MKLWKLTLFYTVSLLIFSGCAVGTPSPKEETVIDSTLPVVTLTEHGVVADMKAIGFEWKSVKDPRVKGIYVFKATSEKEGFTNLDHYKTIEGRFSTHYVDFDVKPNTRYRYSFKTFSADAQSKESKVVAVASKKVLNSVSWIHAQTGMPRTAKIIWRPHSNEIVKSYILERSTLENEDWKELDEIDGRLSAEYIDRDLKDNYVYKYRLRAKTYNDIISAPSDVVKVITKALPLSVMNIQATNNLPKKIKVTWTPSTAKDFDLYNVYRSKTIDGTYTLVATLHNPIFEDESIEKDGQSYFYRVSVVDKDGLESEHDSLSIQGMSLIKLNPPAIFNATLVGNRVEIVWGRVDPRTRSYIIRRTEQQGWFDKKVEEYKNLTNKRFVDNRIVNNATYTYKIYAVDENGIVSEPSTEINLKAPESDTLIDAAQTPVDANPNAQKVVAPSSDTATVVAPTEDLDMSGL